MHDLSSIYPPVFRAPRMIVVFIPMTLLQDCSDGTSGSWSSGGHYLSSTSSHYTRLLHHWVHQGRSIWLYSQEMYWAFMQYSGKLITTTLCPTASFAFHISGTCVN